MIGCLRYAILAVVVVSVTSQSSSRAINASALWSKYNLIVKPTAASAVPLPTLTTPVADVDARYKASVVKTKYKPEIGPYNHKMTVSIDPGSEEQAEYSQEVAEEEAEDDAEEVEEEEEEMAASDEQGTYLFGSVIVLSKVYDEAHRSTTQRAQSIHHKAPVKVAVVDVSASKVDSNKHKKTKKGYKPSASATSATSVVHHHHHVEDEGLLEEAPVSQKGHKHKLKKYKIKGLKKLKKYMLPLLLAYKLKFFTLVPLLLGGLILIVASTGFAGFFFALFAVGVGLKRD